jgi:hypothetical protein
MNLAPPQNLWREGVLKYDSFCAQSNCYVCGRGQWEDREYPSLFVVVAPPCIMDSVTPLLPCLAWPGLAGIMPDLLPPSNWGWNDGEFLKSWVVQFSRAILVFIRSFFHPSIKPTRCWVCVSHCGLVIYIFKVCMYL